MDFNNGRRERPPVPADCRNCPGYSQPVPYGNWQGMPRQPMMPRDNVRMPWDRPMQQPVMPRDMGMPWDRPVPQPMMPRDMGMPQQPMPYYMSYPYPLYMQSDEEDEKDMERIVSMFPRMAKKIQPMVEDECDRMEYDGSLMFDEYPDKVMMEKIMESIYQRIGDVEAEEISEIGEKISFPEVYF